MMVSELSQLPAGQQAYIFTFDSAWLVDSFCLQSNLGLTTHSSSVIDIQVYKRYRFGHRHTDSSISQNLPLELKIGHLRDLRKCLCDPRMEF